MFNQITAHNFLQNTTFFHALKPLLLWLRKQSTLCFKRIHQVAAHARAHFELKIQIPLACRQHNTTCREKETAEHNIKFSSTALAYPEGELEGQIPPLNIQKFS